MWTAIGTSEVLVEEVLPALLSIMENRPPYGTDFCSGDNEAVLALAVSFWSWPLLALRVASAALPTLQLPAPGAGLRAGLRGSRPGAPRASPPGPCHMDTSALSAASGCFVSCRQLWHSG